MRYEWTESKLSRIDGWRTIAAALSQSRPMAARLDILTFFIDEEEEA